MTSPHSIIDRLAAAALPLALHVSARLDQCVRLDEVYVVILGGRDVALGGGRARDHRTAVLLGRGGLVQAKVEVLDLTRFLGRWRRAVERALAQ